MSDGEERKVYQRRKLEGTSKWDRVIDIVEELVVQQFPRMSFRVGVLYDREGKPFVAVGFWHGRTYRYAAMDLEKAKELVRYLQEAIAIVEGKREVVDID